MSRHLKLSMFRNIPFFIAVSLLSFLPGLSFTEDFCCGDLSVCEVPAEEEANIPAYLIPYSLGDCGDITYKPGFRVQTRYWYDDEENNHDIFIRRFRLKCGGDVFGLGKYYAELKIDNVSRFCKDPKANIENAWVDFIVCPDWTYLRVGLYDIPFSRNALTSDSKLLFMDRSLIKQELTGIGFTDNTAGLLLHGRPYCGRFEYAVGIFDNDKFEKLGESGEKYSDQLMPAGRVVWHAFDRAEPLDGYADYWESYLCEGHRLEIGANAAYLGGARDESDKLELYAYGADLFYNRGRFVFQAEYDWFKENVVGSGPDVEGYGWYAQAGYLFYRCFEFAVRYQELDANKYESDEKYRWTSIGLNTYLRGHNLKIQTDYTFKNDEGDDYHNKDLFQIQLQFDY